LELSSSIIFPLNQTRKVLSLSEAMMNKDAENGFSKSKPKKMTKVLRLTMNFKQEQNTVSEQ